VAGKIPSERNFGLWFAVLAAAFGVWRPAVRWQLLGVAGLLVLAAMIAPRLLRPFNVGWYHLGMALGRVVNPIVMAVIFFAVVTPIGLLRTRVFGQDPLRCKLDPDAGSYWIPRANPPESMRRQF
jgi:hypothetical protein